MLVTDAERTLLGLLREEGQRRDGLEPARAWKAFRRFMNVPVAGVAEDAMLYEYLIAEFGGPRRFVLSLCRQFDLEEERTLLQLRCEIAYDPAPALEALGRYHQWWSEECPVGEALDAIERRSEWAVIAAHAPVESTVFLEDAC